MSITKINTLLGLNVYKISSAYIEKIRELNPQREKFRNNLPKFCVTKDKITLTEYHFQFTSTGQEQWILFDIEYCHPAIQVEINESDEEYFFREIDLFNFIQRLPFQDEEFYNKCYSIPVYLIIEITYINSYNYYSGGYECEIEYKILNQLHL